MFSTPLSLSLLDLERAIALRPITVVPDTFVTDAIALLSAIPITPANSNNEVKLSSDSVAQVCPGCLAVVAGTQLVGLFSDRDVTRWVASGRSLSGVTLAEVLEPIVVSLRRSELIDISTVLNLLLRQHIQYLPFLADDGQLIGIVTYESVCRLVQSTELNFQVKAQITELSFEAERSQLLMAVSTRIRASLSLTETLTATVAEVRQLLGCDRVSIYHFDENYQFQVVAESIAANQRSFVSEAIFDPCFASDWAEHYSQAQVSVVADIYTVGLTPCHVELLERLQIRAKILIPVIIENQFWGLVSASESAAPRDWQLDEVVFLEQLAIQVTIAIQQSQTTTLLQRQQQELKVLLDREKQASAKQNALINVLLEWQNRHHAAQQATRQVLYEWDVAADHITWDANVDQVFGYFPSEMPQLSAGWFANIHPEDEERVQTATVDYLEHRGHLCLEYRCRHRDGHYLWVEDQAQFFEDGNGNLNRTIGYIADISERKQLELALRESEAQLRQIFDNSQDVFFLKAFNDGQVIYTSPAWEELYQTPLQQTYDNPKAWLNFIHPEDRDRVIKFSQKARRGELSDLIEHRIVRPDGSIRWIWNRVFPIRNEVGEIYRIAGVNIDITERKQTEAALSASESKYRMLFNSIDEGFCITELIFDENNKPIDYRFLEISPSFEHQTGLANAVGKRMRELAPNHEEYWFEICGKVALTGEPIRFENWAEQLHRWYDVYAFRVGVPEDRQVAILFQDISDRQHAEAKLRQQEEFLRSIYTGVEQAIFVIEVSADQEFRYLDFNPVAEQYGSVPNKEIQGKTPEEAFGEAIGSAVRQNYIQCLQAGQKISYEECLALPTGSIWTLTNLVPIRSKAGHIHRIIGTAVDVTDRKQAEAALRSSEQTLSQVTNMVPGAVYKYRRSAAGVENFVFLSQGIVDLYEHTPEEILNDGQLAWDIILPEDVERMSASIDQSAVTLEPWEFEFRIRTASGVLKWILGYSAPTQETDSSIVWFGILTDISDRKHMEIALQESEQRYRNLAEAMPQMVWIADATGAITYFNQRWYDYTALSKAESMGLGAGSMIHPDERDRVLQQWEQVVLSGVSFEMEIRFRRQDGQYRWFISRGLPIYNSEDAITNWFGTITDIDAFKCAEIARRQMETRFRAIFEQAAVGIAEIEPSGRFLRVNQRYCDILGYTEAEMLQLTFQSITPDVDELSTDLFYQEQLLIGQIDSFCLEKRLLCKDASFHWCQITVFSIRSNVGTVEYCIAVVQDIQARKQAELALRDSEARLNDVLSSAGAAIGHFRFYENGDWETEYHSRGSEQVFGYVPDNFMAEVWLSGIVSEDWATIQEPMLAAIRAETKITIEYRFHCSDGSTRWISDTITSRWNESESCWVVTAIGTDVSDRKRAEIALQQLNQQLEVRITRRTAALSESEARYRTLFEQAAVGISRCDLSGQYLQVNQRFCDLVGYAQTELLKMSWRDLMHPDDLEENRVGLAQLHRGEQGSITTESRYICKQDQVHWVNITVSMLYDAEGVLISDLAVIEDISDRKQIEQKLQNSEKRLKEIITKTVDGILILDPQGQILFCNPAAERILGCHKPYCQGELLKIPLTLQKTFEWDIPCRNGGVTTAEMRVEEITWQDKKAFLSAIRDISERKRVQMALQTSESSYRTLAENLPGIVYRLVPQQNYKITLFNDRLVTLLNLAADDLTYEGNICLLDGLIVSEDHDRVVSTIQGAIANHQPFQVEYCIQILKTGEKRYLLEQGSAVIDHIGQALHIVGIIFDVTEVKRTGEQLRQINEKLTIANAELARATRLKDEFLANMSHELRTPLNSILGLSEVLQERTYGDLTEQQHRALTIIQNNGRHLLELITDILDLAKIESGKLELQTTLVPIHQLCQSTAPFIQQQAFKNRVSFKLKIAPYLDSIEVDERLIRQVLINLLSNAVKFTPSGGSVTLKVQGNFVEQSLCFSVIDTGIGIASEDVDKLFQPFVQVDSSLARRYSGTGLGLALVRRIVELHNGKITVVSTVGQGSQFSVILPWKHNESHKLALSESDIPAPSHSSESSLLEMENIAERPVVLLVEDSIDNVETLRAYLELKGFDIVVAYNGLQAIQLTQSHSFNLILMDIQMPDMDGLEVIRQIRSHEQAGKIPILAVTALAMPGDKEKCLAAGVDDYLSKPISPIHLVSVMKKYLQLCNHLS